jgi:glucose-6-phosphate isomerase, archaeal
MTRNWGLAVQPVEHPLGFRYGPGTAGPEPEVRTLDSIRQSLLEPDCTGPDPVYAIAMDVAHPEHRAILEQRMLLFGVVAYPAGRLGPEAIHSQGHVHKVAAHSGWSPPELFEIWEGVAVVYMQEFAARNPGRCFAIEAHAGSHVIVPPGWAHMVVNADPARMMVFGAWCDRQYGFEYAGVRALRGLGWYPLLDSGDRIAWVPNPRYEETTFLRRAARSYREFGIKADVPIYEQFAANPESVAWVSNPEAVAGLWRAFEP